ncbi:MAG: hypothetical protein HYY52_08290 [Candidatus Melainabacteria bacterium]|nr:hypothetical protein [Candidatus Melainabacteria bacterium]
MPISEPPSLTPEQKKKIEQNLVNIFKDICFNSTNILKAKDESDHISEEIKNFILSYAESGEQVNEVDLLVRAKEKGLELVENHDLVFFDEGIDQALTMRAFLIPGLKVDFTEENASEKITEHDLQAIDHELCVSFKTSETNQFTKLGNLLDIRANLAKALNQKSKDDKEVINLIKQNEIFKTCLNNVFNSASGIISGSEG